MGLKSINTDGCKLKIFYISIVLRKKTEGRKLIPVMDDVSVWRLAMCIIEKKLGCLYNN
jgi:hypothetical protein